MLETITIEPRSRADAAVIWLHGLGADGHDFEPLVPDIGARAGVQARFVLPHAPYRPITVNNGYVMRGWYDIYEMGSLQREDAAGIRDSAQAVQVLIQQQLDAGIPAQRIVIAGFSQGAAIALHTALRYPQSLAGIIALSGYLPLAATLADERHAANAATPVFLAHGSQDDIVPLRLGERTREVLDQSGYRIEWHTYPMPHSVCAEEARDIAGFLASVLTDG